MHKSQEQINEYNKEPVMYCKHCLSLRILGVQGVEDLDYCDECGNTDIGELDIHTWENMYKERYGVEYLNKKY